MTAETLIRELGGRNGMALCPAHDDRNPSLHITQKQDRVLLKCFAGCTQKAVIEALKARGLWNVVDTPQSTKIIAEYNYTDERGELLYQVVRKEPKAFLQRYPDGSGGWIWKKHPNQVLYRLPEVLEAPIVFITEGEKDAEVLRQYGFVATTNAGGCRAPWLDSFTEVLRGRECIIIPDNDPPGWKRAALIAKKLLGSAARIRVLDLPRESKDVSDWFTAGHSECELISMLEGVDAV